MHRACSFGMKCEEYFNVVNQQLLTVIQIETKSAVRNAEKIAGVDGVDKMFLGPSDLSVNMGIPRQTTHPKFRAAVERVVGACRNSGKVTGTLVSHAEGLRNAAAAGLTMILYASDGVVVAQAIKPMVASF